MYRATMLVGFSLIAFQATGETVYSEFMKKQRNQEIDEEKKTQDKIGAIENEDGPKLEKKSSLNPLSARDIYKQERLQKIKDLRF